MLPFCAVQVVVFCTTTSYLEVGRKFVEVGRMVKNGELNRKNARFLLNFEHFAEKSQNLAS